MAATLGVDLDAPVVPMDGFHLPNSTLDAHGVREVKGAPETFAADDFVRLVRRLRQNTETVWCPTFDRIVDEPIPDQVRVGADATVVIVEGNYLLLDEPPWAELVELLDDVVYLEVPTALRLGRLVDRHVQFGRSRFEALDFVHRSDETNTTRIEHSRHRARLLVV